MSDPVRRQPSIHMWLNPHVCRFYTSFLDKIPTCSKTRFRFPFPVWLLIPGFLRWNSDLVFSIHGCYFVKIYDLKHWKNNMSWKHINRYQVTHINRYQVTHINRYQVTDINQQISIDINRYQQISITDINRYQQILTDINQQISIDINRY